MSTYSPNLKLQNSHYLSSWSSSKWGRIIQDLQPLCTPPHSNSGTLCISAIEELVTQGKIITEPWIGFLHYIPSYNTTSIHHYHELETLLRNTIIIQSLPYCKGIFVMSSDLQQYLHKTRPNLPVANILTHFKWKLFQTKRQIVSIEEILSSKAFNDLKVPSNFTKILLKLDESHYDGTNKENTTTINIRLVNNRHELDDILSSSIVFLNLHTPNHHTAINTIIIECIGRNTPLIINRSSHSQKYLGTEYPLFYDTLEQANTMIADDNLLLKGTHYMQKSLQIKPKYTRDHFLSLITQTAIYRCLPSSLPITQSYDLTIVICSYKRVYNLNALLQSFTLQDFKGSFEIILWNNNYETQQEVDQIVAKYKECLTIRLIQSSENYYCIIRLAVARLMRSNYLLVCDDDILPQSNFITTFINKYKQYGPHAVLCCRGQVFSQHILNEESPEEFWSDPDDGILKKFFDESQPDRQIHFMHASTSFYPREILLQANTYDLPTLDTALVDDYWLSFVLSHKLKVPLWKIQGNHIFSHTTCADDPNIALYKRPEVKEEQTIFYIRHMREGWPASTPLPI